MTEAAATLPGPRLKAERERRGLSAQKAADEMHVDRWVIEALETDDYKRIGPTVYAKGHLKKYAALLGLPAGEIMAGYDSRPAGPPEMTSAGPSMLLTTREEGSSFSNWSPLQIFIGLFAALLVVGVLLWRPWHQRAKNTNSAPPAAAAAPSPAKASRQMNTETTDARDPPAAAAAPSAPNAAASNSSEDEQISGVALGGIGPSSMSAAPAGAPGPIPGTGRARLRLSFSAESWVDVHDANGRRTFAGNGLANSVKTIAGAAPLRVYLGSGSGVQLEINDRAVAIGPQFFAGDVARFEAGADGVLRRDSRNEPAHIDPSRAAPSRNSRPPG